ncbi:Endonuclease/exonuclease/phosphatase [Cinara cedri]|uniref:Endonuclease/exonuclease/phosphatase n=1 Tax=Cinara cedri TaxID=506608 RepID=A0A5E4NN28_9HEMI|nr:Endonuclease/exonuclease/phosphatase [Cinara cedri]
MVLSPTAELAIEDYGAVRGFVWILTRELRIYICYNSRNDSDVNYAAFLTDIETSVRSANPHTQLIIGGDLNAWSQEWGLASNGYKRDQLAYWASSLDFLIGNSGQAPINQRVNVLEDVESANDHSYIEYHVSSAADENSRRLVRG